MMRSKQAFRFPADCEPHDALESNSQQEARDEGGPRQSRDFTHDTHLDFIRHQRGIVYHVIDVMDGSWP